LRKKGAADLGVNNPCCNFSTRNLKKNQQLKDLIIFQKLTNNAIIKKQ